MVRASRLIAVGAIGVALAACSTPSPSPTPPPTQGPVRAAAWVPTGSLLAPRADAAATTLADGRVLVIGGRLTLGSSEALSTAEIYDPLLGTWAAAGNMITARASAIATTLSDGRVLVAGGQAQGIGILTAELFDPQTGSWSSAGSTRVPRVHATAMRLTSGRVLVIGGNRELLAETYDPATGQWGFPSGEFLPALNQPSVTLLSDGTILVAGGEGHGLGQNVGDAQAGAQIYDPTTDEWTATGSMTTPRAAHSATLLVSGKVLVAGGFRRSINDPEVLASAELYDPETGTWSETTAMPSPHSDQTASRLPDGRVLLFGGIAADSQLPAIVYEPNSRSWAEVAGQTQPGIGFAAAELINGKILAAGGYSTDDPSTASGSVVIFDPGYGDPVPLP